MNLREKLEIIAKHFKHFGEPTWTNFDDRFPTLGLLSIGILQFHKYANEKHLKIIVENTKYTKRMGYVQFSKIGKITININSEKSAEQIIKDIENRIIKKYAKEIAQIQKDLLEDIKKDENWCFLIDELKDNDWYNVGSKDKWYHANFDLGIEVHSEYLNIQFAERTYLHFKTVVAAENAIKKYMACISEIRSKLEKS